MLATRPKLIGEEPDYLPPLDEIRQQFHRNRKSMLRAQGRLPDPTFKSHVVQATNRLRRLWISGVGWDYRVRPYSVAEVMRRVWIERLAEGRLAGDPLVGEVLRRARVVDPFEVRAGRWVCRHLTAREMRRAVVVAMNMRAERRLAKETG